LSIQKPKNSADDNKRSKYKQAPEKSIFELAREPESAFEIYFLSKIVVGILDLFHGCKACTDHGVLGQIFGGDCSGVFDLLTVLKGGDCAYGILSSCN
jgi:hypothetical protein